MPDDFVPTELRPGQELVVYRIVKSDDRDSQAFLDSFKSHAELGLRPRGPEAMYPLIHRGLSAYDSVEAAVETARRFTAIGDHVAELRIGSGSGVSYYYWGPSGHLTLWGDALMVSQTAVGTIPSGVAISSPWNYN